MDRALVVPVLLLLLGSLVAPATLAQTPPGPHDAVRAFLSAFEDEGSCRLYGLAFLLSRYLGPLCEFEGRKLRTFYDTYLSSQSRARASPIQFARFFTDNKLRLSVGPDLPFSSSLHVVLREPMYNDGRDLALVHAVVTVHGSSYDQRGGWTEDGRIGNWLASMLTRPRDGRPNYYAHSPNSGVVEALYLVVKEGAEWRLVLHEPVMTRMQELPPQPTSPPSLSLPYPALGQTASAGEPLILYLMSIFSASVQWNADEGLARDFYHRYLASHTRGQITEADFVAHWMHKAHRQWLEPLGGPWAISRLLNLDYTVDTPQYNDTRDQARIRATITTRGGPVLSAERTRTDVVAFRVIKDGKSWRLELPDSLVEEIQPPRPPQVLVRWFPNAVASADGILIHIRQVAVEKDLTTLAVRIENSDEREASLFWALAGATLTDEQGKTFRTRMLRTSVPERIPGRSSAAGIIAFEPIAAVSKPLVLTIPDVGVGVGTVTLRLDIPPQRP